MVRTPERLVLPLGRHAASNQVVIDANGVDDLADKNVGLVPDPDREAVGTAALAAPGEPPDHLGEGEDLVGWQGGCGCLQGMNVKMSSMSPMPPAQWVGSV